MIVVPQVAFRAGEVALGEQLPPVRVVRELVNAGAVEVSILDLDGSLAHDVLPQWLEGIVAVAGAPMRFDGHLHDGVRIERLARVGFDTVVVDQTAVFEPVLLRWALDMYGPRLAVEVQVDGEYVFDPPTAAFGRELVDVLADLHLQGVRRLLFRDVTGQVLPLHMLQELGDRLPGMRVAYQGRAVRTPSDIARLSALGQLLECVLVDHVHFVDGGLDFSAANQAAGGEVGFD